MILLFGSVKHTTLIVETNSVSVSVSVSTTLLPEEEAAESSMQAF